jgi:hypothetical protein
MAKSVESCMKAPDTTKQVNEPHHIDSMGDGS